MPRSPRRGEASTVEEVHRRRADEVGDEHAAGPVVDLLRRAELLDHALVHDGDRVGHRHRLDLVVGDVDGGRVDAVVQRAQLARTSARGTRRRACRAARPSGRPSAGARWRGRARRAGGRRRQSPPTGGRADGRSAGAAPSPRRCAGSRRAGMPWAAQRKADVPAHVHVRVEREQLEHEGDVALARRAEGDVLAVEADAARGRQLEPGDHPQRRRLAAARRARAGRRTRRRSTVKFESCTATKSAKALCRFSSRISAMALSPETG